MTHILHQLRKRSSAVLRSLLLVLLAAWLSMVSPPCVNQAEAAPVSPPIMPCHSQDGLLADQQSCCQHADTGPCAEETCAAMPVSMASESTAPLISSAEPPFVFLATVVAIELHDAPLQYRPEPLRMSAADDGPLYLRHCCFLN